MTNSDIPKIRRPKGLLIDLDGTVLPASQQPSERVKAAIKAASEIIPVAIASGRDQNDVCHYARLFGLTTIQIADNGATLVDPISGQAVVRRTFSKADAMMTVSALEQAASRVLVVDAGRFTQLDKNIAEWDITLIMGEFVNESEATHWAERLGTDTVTATASVANGDNWCIDCTVAGVDKAFGATEFARLVGIELDDLMVIGDGWNDVPMFKVSGMPIAMNGAPAELLELAIATTPDITHEGAAIAIEKYILSR